MTVPIPEEHPDITVTTDEDITETVSMISSYLMDRISLYVMSGLNNRNTPQYTEYKDIPCRFEYDYQLLKDESGNQTVSRARIYLGRKYTINPATDYFVYDKTKYQILEVYVMRSFTQEHLEVLIK
jgi:hypothetical protein